MATKERIREALTGLPSREYMLQRVGLGWRPAAIEWERDIDITKPGSSGGYREEIPYGLQVSDDCSGLVENAAEREVITMALDMIVDDHPLSKVAHELTLRGYRMRDGRYWTPSALFDLLPRMIEVGPRLFSSDEWRTRRQHLPRVV